MNLKLGDLAPNFTAKTSQGDISFHDYLADSWAVLFSHPADYTPVCTTELGRTASLKSEFEKRNVKVIALSVDSVESHKGWINDINETQHFLSNRLSGAKSFVINLKIRKHYTLISYYTCLDSSLVRSA